MGKKCVVRTRKWEGKEGGWGIKREREGEGEREIEMGRRERGEGEGHHKPKTIRVLVSNGPV